MPKSTKARLMIKGKVSKNWESPALDQLHDGVKRNAERVNSMAYKAMIDAIDLMQKSLTIDRSCLTDSDEPRQETRICLGVDFPEADGFYPCVIIRLADFVIDAHKCLDNPRLGVFEWVEYLEGADSQAARVAADGIQPRNL